MAHNKKWSDLTGRQEAPIMLRGSCCWHCWQRRRSTAWASARSSTSYSGGSDEGAYQTPSAGYVLRPCVRSNVALDPSGVRIAAPGASGPLRAGASRDHRGCTHRWQAWSERSAGPNRALARRGTLVCARTGSTHGPCACSCGLTPPAWCAETVGSVGFPPSTYSSSSVVGEELGWRATPARLLARDRRCLRACSSACSGERGTCRRS